MSNVVRFNPELVRHVTPFKERFNYKGYEVFVEYIPKEAAYVYRIVPKSAGIRSVNAHRNKSTCIAAAKRKINALEERKAR